MGLQDPNITYIHLPVTLNGANLSVVSYIPPLEQTWGYLGRWTQTDPNNERTATLSPFFPAQILLLPVMMMPNTSKLRWRADSRRQGAKKGLEDGGEHLRGQCRMVRRQEQQSEWCTRPSWQAALCQTESRKSSCHVSFECRRKPQETSSTMPLQTCRYIMNESVILFLMVQPVSSRALCADDRKSLRGNLNVLICGALTAASHCFWSSHPAPDSNEIEMLMKRRKKESLSFLSSLCLLLACSLLSNQLLFPSPDWLFSRSSLLHSVCFPPFLFLSTSLLSPLLLLSPHLFSLHSSSPLIFCLFLHLLCSLISPYALLSFLLLLSRCVLGHTRRENFFIFIGLPVILLVSHIFHSRVLDFS